MNKPSNRSRIRMRRAAIALTVSFALILAVEVGVRATGLADFPIYAVDDDISYMLRPNQAGTFLNRNSWVFNDRSMGVAQPWDQSGHLNILLIGNSIVYGGDSYDQPEKLGPTIQRELGADFAVWPIAAGGWTNVNEMAYLDRNPDIAAATQFFVWEFMEGGLSKAAPWAGEYVWPQERPVWAGWYVFHRFVLEHMLSDIMKELPSTGVQTPSTNLPAPAAMEKFTAAIHRLSLATGRPIPGILLLYPTEYNLTTASHGEEWLPDRPFLDALARQHNLLVIDVAKDACWNSSLYRPDHVHPTTAGNAVLAHVVARAVKAAASADPSAPAGLAETRAPHEPAGCQGQFQGASQPGPLARR